MAHRHDLGGQLATMLDVLPMMAWTSGEDGSCTFVNKALLDFTRTSLEEEVGPGWGERVHPQDGARADATYQAAFDARQPFRMEYRVRRHDGQYRFVLSLGVPRLSECGEFEGYLGFSVDVTELREAERDASAERSLYRSFLGGLRDHISVLAPDGTVVWVNDAWRAFGEKCGLALPEGGIGANYLAICDDATGPDAEEAAAVAEGIRDVVAGRLAVYEREYPCHEPGTNRWFLLRVVPVQDGGEVAALTQHVDTTPLREAQNERLALESKLQHVQRLESLGVMAAGIAHDFNNLLTVVQGNAQIVLDDLPQDSAARTRLQRIGKAARHAARLTEQMLSYAGKAAIELEPTDLSRTVSDVRDLLRSMPHGRGRLETRLADALPLVEADATQMRQVILALVTNAFEALEGKAGYVEVSTGSCTVDAADLSASVGIADPRPGRYVCLEVRDTGRGIEPEDRFRIFEPYFSTRFSGRGLGLASVLGIVQAHGGVILVDGAPDEGSSIRVLLPPAAAQPEALAFPAPQKAESRGGVLVVDDEPDVLEIAAEFLARAGYEVIAAEGGHKGIEALRSRADDIDVVLLDLAMPEVSGEDALSEMRQIRPTLPILMASGFSEKVARERYQIEGIAGFLRKPYEPDQLTDMLDELLRR